MSNPKTPIEISFDDEHLRQLAEFLRQIGEEPFCLGPTDRTALIESIGMMLALCKAGLIGPSFSFNITD